MKTQGLSLKALIILGFVACLLTALTAAFPAAADMSGHGGMIRTLDVSPDGRRVLSGSFDFTARLWNFSEQTEIGVLDAHAGPVTNVAFVGNGDQALTTSDDMTAILWNLKTLKPVKRLTGHGHKVIVYYYPIIIRAKTPTFNESKAGEKRGQRGDGDVVLKRSRHGELSAP